MTYLKPLAAAFCVALTAASAPLFGQTAIPNTRAGKVPRAWVDAYNSGDSARVAMFFRTYSVEDALRGAFAFRKMTGGLDLLSVQASEPRHVEFMTRFRARPMVGYGALDVSAADTSRVSGYLFPLGMNVFVDDIRIDAPTRDTCKSSTACYPEVRNRNRIRSLNIGASAKPTARSGRPGGSRGTSGTYGSTGLSIRPSAGRPLSRRSPPWPKRTRSSLTCGKTRAAVKPARLLSPSRTCLTAVLISVTCGSVMPATHGSAGRWTPLPVRASAGRSLSMC